MAKRVPLIVVLGATACGKTKLAIDLARRFGGEIISADSMQVYKGLDIVTNKVTEEEQSQAKHHLIDFLTPLQRFSVVDFRDQAVKIIDQLIAKKKIPILVGGTNYYIESILWKNFIVSPEVKDVKQTVIDDEYEILKFADFHKDEDFESVEKFFKKPIFNDGFKNVDGEKLWKILEQVDPTAAHLYHMNNKRRIIRCLQIIQRRQENYSEILKKINVSQTSGSSLGGPLRYPETCVFWLDCDNDVLDKILDERVDQMLERGLLEEIECFHEDYNKQRLISGEEPDYEKGIFQSIGFKEFHDYLALNQEERSSQEGVKLFKRSVVMMKQSTRKYARKQLKWIKSRFQQSETRDLPPLYKLPVSHDDWNAKTQAPAFEIVDHILNNRMLSDNLLYYQQDLTAPVAPIQAAKFYCEACNKVYIGSRDIDVHLKSKRHQKRVSKVKKRKVDDQKSDANTASKTATI